MTQTHNPDSGLFVLLRDWLFFLDRDAVAPPLLLDAFIMKFFAHAGLAPELDRCVVSGISYHDMVKEELTNASPAAQPGLYFAGGGVVSSFVRKEKERVGEEVYPCGVKDISNLKLLLAGNWEVIAGLQLEENEQETLHKLVYAFSLYHSERQLTDWWKTARVERMEA